MKRIASILAALALAALCGGQVPMTGAGTGAPAAAGKGLQTSLAAFWEFESTSWTDATGNGNTLTGLNSPTSSNTAPAVVGNYANLVAASSQDLSVASNSGIQVGGASTNFSIAGWFYLSGSFNTGKPLVSKFGAFGNREFFLTTNFFSSNVFEFHVVTNGGGSDNFIASSTAISVNTFYFVSCTYNGTSGAMTISVNAGTRDTGTATLLPVANSTAAFFVANDANSTGFYGMRIDQFGIWKGRLLSISDESLLYNSGAGLSYAAMQ